MYSVTLSLRTRVVRELEDGTRELKTFSEMPRKSLINLHKTAWYRQPSRRLNLKSPQLLQPMISKQENSMELPPKSTEWTQIRGMAPLCVLEVIGRIPSSRQPTRHRHRKKWTRIMGWTERTRSINSFNQVSSEAAIKNKHQSIMIVKVIKPVLDPTQTGKLKAVWQSQTTVEVEKLILSNSARSNSTLMFLETNRLTTQDTCLWTKKELILIT